MKECPVCDSRVFMPFLTCRDYLVSGEEFSVVNCSNCGFKFTDPAPGAKEVGKYYASEEYISHSNAAKGLVNKVYRLVRNYTLIKKRNLVTPPNLTKGEGKRKGEKGKLKLLDIGCGTGEFLNVCKKAGWETTGIEPGNTARKYAMEKHGLNVSEELNSLKDLHSEFDVITMWHVLEHVHKLNETIALMKQLLKKTGTLVVALPNCSSWDARVYRQYWAAYDVPRHLYHFTPNDVEALFSRNGMAVSKVLPMWFDAFYIAMLSEKHKNGKTNYLRALYNGLRSNLKALKTGRAFSSQVYVIKTPA